MGGCQQLFVLKARGVPHIVAGRRNEKVLKCFGILDELQEGFIGWPSEALRERIHN
jgi:hypothetical protein